MEPLSRKEIKEIFTEAVESIVIEFKASHDAHEKEIDRLRVQSGEHYLEIKELKDNMQKQIMHCQSSATTSQEKTGTRMGSTEKDIARIDQKIIEIENDLSEIKTNKQFNISQWLVVAGVVAMIILGVIPLLKG